MISKRAEGALRILILAVREDLAIYYRRKVRKKFYFYCGKTHIFIEWLDLNGLRFQKFLARSALLMIFSLTECNLVSDGVGPTALPSSLISLIYSFELIITF